MVASGVPLSIGTEAATPEAAIGELRDSLAPQLRVAAVAFDPTYQRSIGIGDSGWVAVRSAAS